MFTGPHGRGSLYSLSPAYVITYQLSMMIILIIIAIILSILILIINPITAMNDFMLSLLV